MDTKKIMGGKMTKFYNFYNKKMKPVTVMPDKETKLVDQSEADRASLKFQLERYGMDSLMQQLEKTKAQFGYADTRLTKNFTDLAQEMAEANSYFMKLPAKIRKEFGHDAVKFYDTIEKQPEKMYKDGYISKELANKLGVITEVKNDFEIPVTPTTEIKTEVETTTTEN